jgi:hypothetical protein
MHVDCINVQGTYQAIYHDIALYKVVKMFLTNLYMFVFHNYILRIFCIKSRSYIVK